MPASILFLSIGFLLAVLLTDMIFDAQALPYRGKDQRVPEEVLASLSHYYRRLTKIPQPLFAVMLTLLVVILSQIIKHRMAGWVGWSSLTLFLISAGYAVAFIIPTASQLSSRKDTIEKQSELAHRLFPAHALCFVLILALGAIQYYIALGS
jgi:cell division protein FtsW (lipid II flippase)